jgi:hypothetical protein
LVFLQQVQLLISQVEPESDEVEGSRLGDFLKAEKIAVEMPAPGNIGDDDRNVVDLLDLKSGHVAPVKNSVMGGRGA